MNWLLLPTLAGYGLALIGLAGWYVDNRDLKKTRIVYWNERDGKIKAEDKLATVQSQRDTAMQAFSELDVLHQKVVAERDKWSKLYNELLTTYHAAQGDAHATVPLEEAAPEPVTLPSPPDVPFLTPALRELEKPKRPARGKKAETKQ